jgi:hypothetical protein
MPHFNYRPSRFTVRDINRVCRGGSNLYYPHPDYGDMVRVVEARTHNGISQLRAYTFGKNIEWFDADYSLIEQR